MQHNHYKRPMPIGQCNKTFIHNKFIKYDCLFLVVKDPQIWQVEESLNQKENHCLPLKYIPVNESYDI